MARQQAQGKGASARTSTDVCAYTLLLLLQTEGEFKSIAKYVTQSDHMLAVSNQPSLRGLSLPVHTKLRVYAHVRRR